MSELYAVSRAQSQASLTLAREQSGHLRSLDRAQNIFGSIAMREILRSAA